MNNTDVCVSYFTDTSKTYTTAKFKYEVKTLASGSTNAALYLFDSQNQTFTLLKTLKQGDLFEEKLESLT